MEYNNTIRIEYNDEKTAKLQKNEVYSCFDEIDATEMRYSKSDYVSSNYRDALKYDGNRTFYIDEDSYSAFATPSDMLELFDIMVKKLDTEFAPGKIVSFNTSTYSDSYAEAIFNEDEIIIKKILYPYGDEDHMLTCPICDSDVIPMSEYDEEKEIVCPECGKKIDLKDQYEENAPIEEVFSIKR